MIATAAATGRALLTLDDAQSPAWPVPSEETASALHNACRFATQKTCLFPGFFCRRLT